MLAFWVLTSFRLPELPMTGHRGWYAGRRAERASNLVQLGSLESKRSKRVGFKDRNSWWVAAVALRSIPNMPPLQWCFRSVWAFGLPQQQLGCHCGFGFKLPRSMEKIWRIKGPG